MEWIKTEEKLPPEDPDIELLGFGPEVSDHTEGVYSIMRYNREWRSKDGTQKCRIPPEYWAYLKPPEPEEDGTGWIKTEEKLPPEDNNIDLLGFGPEVSSHKNGEYSVMRYDGEWWNEDGTERCETPPEYWAYIEPPCEVEINCPYCGQEDDKYDPDCICCVCRAYITVCPACNSIIKGCKCGECSKGETFRSYR